MRPTSIRMLGLVALGTLVAGWGFASLLARSGRLPYVPWLAVLVIWGVAGFVLVWTMVARRRLHPDPGRERMAPLVAARTAALALAGSRTGAVVLGFYAGLALRLADQTVLAAARERLLAAGLAALGGLVLIVLSLWLERICRLPEDPDQSGALGRGSGPASGAGA